MSEDHIKTVVIDLPVEQHATDEVHEEPTADHRKNEEPADYQPAMQSSWLS